MCMKGNGKITNGMEKENNNGKMDHYIKDIGKIIWRLGMVDLSMQMGMSILDSGLMIGHQVKVFINLFRKLLFLWRSQV